MKKSEKFVTINLRDSEGQYTPVSDVVMINLAACGNPSCERMGYCTACGHEIKNHYGVKSPNGAYSYVGSCCKKILCKNDAMEELPAPGMAYTRKDKNYIVIEEEIVNKIGNLAYVNFPGIRHFCGGLWIKNNFFDSIFSQVYEGNRYNHFYSISVKQLEIVNKA